jgi:hypothetical protein
MCREFGFELADLAVEFGDDADRSAGAGPECSGDRGGCGELLGAQHFLNLQCAAVEVALSPSGFERRPDLRQTQPSGVGGCRGAAQDGQRVTVG